MAHAKPINRMFFMPPLLAGPAPEIKTNSPAPPPPEDKKRAPRDAAPGTVPEERTYLETARISAAALSVCSHVKNLKFLSPFLRPKCPYWSVME